MTNAGGKASSGWVVIPSETGFDEAGSGQEKSVGSTERLLQRLVKLLPIDKGLVTDINPTGVNIGHFRTTPMRLSEIRGRNPLLEAGLSRIHRHLERGGALGVISGARGDVSSAENEDAHRRLIARLRDHGYGPIQSIGRSQWGPERSLIVPDARLDDLKKLGNEFAQEAIIHVPEGGRKNAMLHYLDASPEAGKAVDIGRHHFNQPNPKGISILKGLGYSPRDARHPTRSFTFGDNDEIESLLVPPHGMHASSWKPYA